MAVCLGQANSEAEVLSRLDAHLLTEFPIGQVHDPEGVRSGGNVLDAEGSRGVGQGAALRAFQDYGRVHDCVAGFGIHDPTPEGARVLGPHSRRAEGTGEQNRRNRFVRLEQHSFLSTPNW
jgi:hypothetical protein